MAANSSDRANGSQILLTGEISKAFVNCESKLEDFCVVRRNILDAIALAAQNSFSVIAVSMSGSSHLRSALKTLRPLCPTAKIVLLAQMHEEAAALQLISSTTESLQPADDYLICPVQPVRLYELLTDYHYEKAVSYNHEKLKQLEKLATEDELTGLKNRRYIREFSRQIIEYARKENAQVTLLVFDIDNFKHYNDTYNHSVGDEILRQAAILMQRSCRRHDIIGRIGGDEFAVVFWDAPGTKKIKTQSKSAERRSSAASHPKEPVFIAKRFTKELENAQLNSLGSQGKGVLTISGGLATFPTDGSNTEQLFKQADKALLEAKRSGKNRIYLVGEKKTDSSIA
jgi:diguanylate cyclase (GGDEF)-like protein